MGKTAQLAISRGVAESVAGTGITVNSVLPGPTESEGVATFVADLAKQRGVERSVVEAEFFRTARPSSLIKRFATVEDVANMIVYVCSPLASATNGAALRVDGGVVRAIVKIEVRQRDARHSSVASSKTNAVRALDRLGISYELREYEVDPDDLAAETV